MRPAELRVAAVAAAAIVFLPAIAFAAEDAAATRHVAAADGAEVALTLAAATSPAPRSSSSSSSRSTP